MSVDGVAQHDVAGEGMLLQCRILAQGGVEERVGRTKQTTNSGAGVKLSQYALAPSESTWSRMCRAWALSRTPGCARRGLHRLQVAAERDLESTTTFLPPTRRTIRSGRTRPSSPSALAWVT